MAVFDIIVLIIALLAGVSGFRRGFVVEVISTLAFFIGLFVALKVTFPIALRFFGDLEAFWIIALLIFVVLFFLIMWGAKVLAKSIRKGLEASAAGVLDSLMGVLVAVLKWAFTLSVVLWVMNSLDMELPSAWLKGSYLYDPVAAIAPFIFEAFGHVLPFFEDILNNMETPPRRA